MTLVIVSTGGLCPLYSYIVLGLWHHNITTSHDHNFEFKAHQLAATALRKVRLARYGGVIRHSVVASPAGNVQMHHSSEMYITVARRNP